MPSKQDAMTIGEAKAELRQAVWSKEGGRCPCCQRYAKVYRRKITSDMLRVLVKLYHLARTQPDRDFFKVGARGDIRTPGGDYAKGELWGLIEGLPDARRGDGSKRAGYWKISERGKEFVRGKLAVRRYLYEYDRKLVRDPPDADTSLVRIFELAPDFNYSELMSTG